MTSSLRPPVPATSASIAPPTLAGALPAAFDELRAEVEARGAPAWSALLASLSDEARAAIAVRAPVRDACWVEAIDRADEASGAAPGALAAAVGARRADAAIEAAGRGAFAGDPLGFLRAHGTAFHRERSTYGASSLELSGARAIVRVSASSAWLRRPDGLPSQAPRVALGFLDRIVERLGGVARAGRFTGSARRADAIGGVELLNLLFEFDLDPE